MDRYTRLILPGWGFKNYGVKNPCRSIRSRRKGGEPKSMRSKSDWLLSQSFDTQTEMINHWLQCQGLISIRDNQWMKAQGYA